MQWWRQLLIVCFLLLVSSPLRFTDLGYSEFQDDEKKSFIRLAQDETVYEFLLRQRKGPMQFIVSYIPYSLNGNYTNEFAQRLPFALANIAAIGIFYFLLRRLTRSDLAAVFGTLLFSFNGFIVGFSRISQYQNLNLFFSLTSLWFYSNLKYKSSGVLVSSMLGTLFFCLSLLSHWDAIFYLVPIIYFLLSYLFNKEISVKSKLLLVGFNLVLGSVLLLPFMIPYVNYHLNSQVSSDYFERRVGLSEYSFDKHLFIFELYNPYFTYAVYSAFLLIAAFFIRRNYVLWIWFIVNFLAIRFFMAKPGTHIYNYVIPAIVLISTGLGIFLQKAGSSKTKIKNFFYLFLGLLTPFTLGTIFFYQSYMIFVDHAQEYPWESKLLFNRYETKPYVEKEVLTFGFPHFRDWKSANKVMVERYPNCFYLTNEGKEISQIYVDLKYGTSKDCLYVVEVKKPFISTRDGVRFAQSVGKEVIYEYKRGETSYLKVFQAKTPSH